MAPTHSGSGGMPEEQFLEAVDQYSGLLYNVAFRMTGNAEDAEDAVQEAMIAAYRAFPSFRGEAQVSTWLYRIVVNTCLMKIRRERNRGKYLTETGYNDALAPDWSSNPAEAAIINELWEVLETALALLPPVLRSAVVLRDVEGLSGSEAAEALDISVASLKSRLHRGRLLLRKYLDEHLNGW